jgi:hypothetical protein
MKYKCKLCGEVELIYDGHFEDYDRGMSIPVSLCPTLKDVKKYVNDLMGEDYENVCDRKFKDMFKKQTITPSHECIDEVGIEEAMKHLIEPIECWVEDL